MTLREPDRLREIKHWYALHLLPQRRLMEDIHWMVNRIEDSEDEIKRLRALVYVHITEHDCLVCGSETSGTSSSTSS